jgi:hypothetical protein
MPQEDFTSDNRSDAGQSKFPRLKLQANERGRIFVVGKPVKEYVHRLEAPNIVNMAPVYKKITNRDGDEVYVVDTRFVSNPLCFGVYETLKERGFDDKSCEACAVARDRPDIFRPPQPKYALNILRYGLRPGGGWNDIAAPYGLNALIWVFGSKVMDKLIDIRTMGEQYADIRTVDLLIECDKDVSFQKPYSNGDFTPVTPAVWMASEATRSYTAQYLASNGATNEDLAASLGKRVKADWMADDIARVIQRWDVVRAYESRQSGQPAMGPQGFGAETLGQGMSQLQGQYAQGYGGGGASSPTGGGQQGGQGSQFAQNHQSAGVDMSLLGGGGGVVPPPPPPPSPSAGPSQQWGNPAPPPPPPPPQGDYMAAAAQAAQQGQNPAAAAYEAATGQSVGSVPMPQWQPPGHQVSPPDPWTGQQAPGTVPPTTQPPAQTAGAAQPATGSTALQPGSASPPSNGLGAVLGPPQGLEGLNEFMKGKTTNPQFEPGPAQPPESPMPPPPPDTPPASETPQPPPGGYTFADLARMGKQ